ncbi:hypothetical protein PHYBOEH_000602 [Phytophthora boehmeriae]|uniref:RING-type domain-containing protein n=1 Tax=Phytophthora boehmeriae TaxID=109152 RepID=A0A8T1X864_9STRA|nr:hypothetical protein PHYBOEH_000602 [Phytophthora boehmeriae]
MRSPVAMRIEQQTPQPPPDAVAPASNQQEDERAPSSATQFSLDKTESDDEASDGQRSQPQPPDFAGFEPHAEAQSRGKRAWHSRSQHQLLQRTRRRARRSSSGENQSQQSTGDNSTVSEVESAEGEGQTTAGNFAGEIESEAAEIRTLIARTARLWTAVDRAEHSEEVSMRQQSQAMETVSAQIRNELLPTQYTRVEVDDDEDSTLSSDDQDSEDEVDDENTETESLNGTEVRSNQDVAYPARDEAFVSSVQHNNAARVSSAQAHAAEQLPFRVDGENEESHIDDDSESEDFDEMDSEGTPIERGLELEQGEVMDASNRVINAAKARAIKNAMLGNLIKLSFRESITHAALEAGVLEIDHYDSDCELAYVDIFMSLVKMVCDAHVDVINGIDDAAESWMSPVDPTHEIWEAGMEAEYATHFSSDDENEDGDDNSFDSDSVLELQTVDEEKFMDQSVLNELLRRNDGMRNTNPATQIPVSPGEVQAESLTVAPPIARDTCQISDQPWDAPSNCDEDVERPWRRYCEDLIIRNREMQEQVALARRRIVQLSHNNQKLHLLADRVERDRDGLLFENDLLQSQLHGYEDHEHHHDSLMKELIMLRKRLKRKEQTFDVRSPGPSQQMHGHLDAGALTSNFNSLDDIRVALNQLSPRTLASYKMDELKVWEHLLEATLGRVRSAKEEKALEMQKKLDRQAEEQNELMLCVICLSNEKRILCLPCRHLCLCQTCSTREEVDKCPICRLEIEEMLAIYS